MRIKLIDGDASCTKDGSVEFWIERDGIETPVQVSAQAMCANFGATSAQEADLLTAFRESGQLIFAAAEKAARQGAPKHLIVLDMNNTP